MYYDNRHYHFVPAMRYVISTS